MMSSQTPISLLWEWLMPVKCLAYLRSANVCTIWLIDITTNSSVTSDQSRFRSNMRVGNGSVGFVQTLDASGRVRPCVPIFSSNLSIIIDAIFMSMQVLLDRGYLLIKLVNHGCCKLVPMSASLCISESRRACKKCKRKSGKGFHGNIAGFSVGRKHQRKRGKEEKRKRGEAEKGKKIAGFPVGKKHQRKSGKHMSGNIGELPGGTKHRCKDSAKCWSHEKYQHGWSSSNSVANG